MKSKLKIIIPIGIALIAIALAFVFIRFAPTKTTDIGTMISTAQQYLTEQKYEQAIAEFQKIIEIDPKNADAYIGMAKAYIGIGDTDKAVEVLEDGYEQTGDDRILEMLEELKSGEETVETTVTTVETTETKTSETTTEVTETETAETITEVTETEITETTTEATKTEIAETTTKITETEITETEPTKDAKIEQVRQQALDAIALFAPNKSKGEPNSTFYAYFDGVDSDRYDCFKCEYDENGNLKNEYFTEIMVGKIRLGNINIRSGSRTIRMFHRLHDGNYVVCEGSADWGSGFGYWYDTMLYTDLISISENEYTDKYNQLTIHLDNNKVTKVDDYGYNLTYNSELSKWESNMYYCSSPYIIGLPDGYDDSIFEFDDSKIEKTFTNSDEFHDYVEKNIWHSGENN